MLEETGRVVEEVSERIGEATNNVAEYRALLKGLERARHLKAKTIDLRSDSELVVHQMNGRYKVRHDGLKPLWQEAQLAVAGFTRWSILHVPREQNRRADDLANAALDGEM